MVLAIRPVDGGSRKRGAGYHAQKEMPAQDANQLPHVERFDEVIRASGLARLPLPLGGGMPGKKDDGDVTQPVALADEAHRGQPVHARQAPVHQDDVGVKFFSRAHALLPVRSFDDPQPAPLQNDAE